MRCALAGLVLLVLPVPLVAQDAPEVRQMSYVCDRDVILPVTFVNLSDSPGLAVIQIEGKQVALRALPTGTGVRYVAFDEQDSYRLYTKAEEAFVTHLAADHTAQEVPVLGKCRHSAG